MERLESQLRSMSSILDLLHPGCVDESTMNRSLLLEKLLDVLFQWSYRSKDISPMRIPAQLVVRGILDLLQRILTSTLLHLGHSF